VRYQRLLAESSIVHQIQIDIHNLKSSVANLQNMKSDVANLQNQITSSKCLFVKYWYQIPLRGDVFAHTTSLTKPLFIEMLVQNQTCEQSCFGV
jgi:hypothetical protein